MSVKIQCDSCFVDLDNGALVYCVLCKIELSEKIRDLEKQIDNLKSELKEAETEIDLMGDRE